MIQVTGHNQILGDDFISQIGEKVLWYLYKGEIVSEDMFIEDLLKQKVATADLWTRMVL